VEFSQIAVVLLGALAGGIVNGMTGFGTGITAMGLWLYAVSPPVAASLVIICSVVSGLQTMPLVWRAIEARRVLPFIIPGLVGVPIGTWLLPLVDARSFKIVIGISLAAYAVYGLAMRQPTASERGGAGADAMIGLGGGLLGGFSGLSGVLPIVWCDVRGWGKDERRSIMQSFNVAILSAALLSHAFAGLLDAHVAMATAAALPGTMGGAWLGASAYRRLGDAGFRQVILALLLVSGVVLISTSW
jgi:uncharacterized membrane protein YfcA